MDKQAEEDAVRRDILQQQHLRDRKMYGQALLGRVRTTNSPLVDMCKWLEKLVKHDPDSYVEYEVSNPLVAIALGGRLRDYIEQLEILSKNAMEGNLPERLREDAPDFLLPVVERVEGRITDSLVGAMRVAENLVAETKSKTDDMQSQVNDSLKANEDASRQLQRQFDQLTVQMTDQMKAVQADALKRYRDVQVALKALKKQESGKTLNAVEEMQLSIMLGDNDASDTTDDGRNDTDHPSETDEATNES